MCSSDLDEESDDPDASGRYGGGLGRKGVIWDPLHGDFPGGALKRYTNDKHDT